MKETSLSGRIFDTFNILFMILLCVSTIYPFLHLLTLSLSPSDVSFTKLHIFPEKISFVNFEQVLGYDQVLTGFVNSLKRTIIGTVLNVLVTIAGAYVLAKKYFPHRAFWTKFIIFTMFFQGGMIPAYLLVRDLGLMNTTWALILPVLVNPFQLIIARNFMQSLPAELEESARIDGANDIYILWRIIIPLSMPIIATLGLWNAVFHWNSWFDSLIYITDPNKEVLQMVMRRIVLDGQMDMMSNALPEDAKKVNTETIKAATIMVTTIPIILVYPFVQKYFVKGMLIGSVKG